MTAEEIYALPTNEFGWRVLPNGNRVQIGNNVHIGADVYIGADVRIDNDVYIGTGVQIGNNVHIDDLVQIGNGVHIGADVHLDYNRPLMCIYGSYVGNEYAQGVVRIGCELHPIEEFLSNLTAICRKHGEEKLEPTFRAFIESVRDYQAKFPLQTTTDKEVKDEA
jgi:predicted acyltransferase (DUF342 family)